MNDQLAFLGTIAETALGAAAVVAAFLGLAGLVVSIVVCGFYAWAAWHRDH